MRNRILSSILFFGGCFNATFAQLTPKELEKRILEINQTPISQSPDKEKIAAAEEIVELLMEGLTHKESFDYPFDSLRYSTIPVITAPKAPVRIFTFNAILENGKFQHYGVLQWKTKGGIKTYALLDTAENLPKEPTAESLSTSQWIGALYYQMIPYKRNKKDIYILCGFDGHNINSNRSILETLYFEDGEPLFGIEMFRDGEEDPTPEPRVIFEYHKSAKMTLRYQPEVNYIVLDELAPAYEKVKGNPWYNIPTGDYFAYHPEKFSWILKPVTDEMPFADPRSIDADRRPAELPKDRMKLKHAPEMPQKRGKYGEGSEKDDEAPDDSESTDSDDE